MVGHVTLRKSDLHRNSSLSSSCFALSPHVHLTMPHRMDESAQASWTKTQVAGYPPRIQCSTACQSHSSGGNCFPPPVHEFQHHESLGRAEYELGDSGRIESSVIGEGATQGVEGHTGRLTLLQLPQLQLIPATIILLICVCLIGDWIGWS